MYDPKFEKAIQQKMEELEFRPPESVWVNIEKAVVTKRRRRAGFFWRYMLPGVLVVAAAGLYWRYTGGKVTPPVTAVTTVGSPAGRIDHHGSAVAGNGGASGSAARNGGLSGSAASNGGLRGSAARNGGLRGSAAEKDGTGGSMSSRPAGGLDAAAGGTAQAGHLSAGVFAARSGSPARERTGRWKGAGSRGTATTSDETMTTSGETMTPSNETTTASGETTTASNEPAAARQKGFAGSAGQTGPAGRTQAAGQNGLSSSVNGAVYGAVDGAGNGAGYWPGYRPGLADQRLAPQVHAPALNAKKSTGIALAGLSHPARHWEAGFVAGGGLSRLNRLNSDQARVALDPTTTSFYTLSNTSSSSHYISDVRTEASFVGGIYLQRPLNDRWIVNTGMNLHYYSNRISVGQQVTTYVQPSVSFLLATTVQTAATTSVYSAGDTRSVINKYYFLELPIGLQWKVNKSHLVPIFLEGGVSLSRLMGASALFYNAKTGLYSKDGDIVNKTQFTIGSALLVGLPFHGVNIELGPQIQYGLTALVNTQGVGDQHLLYTGIRLVVIPGRK